ncbi:MAG: alkaline phosphatase, partial [Acidobacteria bacterium]|nr:alkaline phosphatase [Acidobacteriota bacterium]
MLRIAILSLCLALTASAKNAKNVILFLGDAGGIATLNAASLLGHGEPQKLYIQSMPHIGLSDTSTASSFVSDSAAGMTAIVTGQKTQNGVISQGPDAVRGKSDGATLKTILEYAEEKGLSTGVITNQPFTDATPAATYAHANNRRDYARIFHDLLNPSYGDGVDVLIGPGRSTVDKDLAEKKQPSIADAMQKAQRPLYESLAAIPGDVRRAIVIVENRSDFSLKDAVDRAITILQKNPKGFFLMVEGDMHTTDVEGGLRRALLLDDTIRATANRRLKNTMLLYTADHSFDLRIAGGERGKPLLEEGKEGYLKDRSYRGKAIR